MYDAKTNKIIMTKKGIATRKSRVKDDQIKAYEAICSAYCKSYDEALRQISFVSSMFVR